ncbi:MAG: hypothetical protein MUF54_15130, partial [Polyangiaceae bacterium]|nr:hypothetical protein [Polyangiaceae bacterium]
MRTIARLLTYVLVPLATALCAGCGAGRHAPPQLPEAAAALVPAAIDEAQFAAAAQQLLANGGNSPERLMLLAGVVRHQFRRAAERFAAGARERGLASVQGALYLIRAGELRPEMLDESAGRALRGAYEAVAPVGREGPALAFLQLRAMALPVDHPDQAKIARHLQAIGRWLKDTRQRTSVENTSANAKAFGEQASLLPSAQTLGEARAMTDRWVTEALQFNERYRPGLHGANRDQMVEAYRGVRTGAIVVAGLYLRHGDAAGAVRALEESEARRVTSPELFERLQTAAAADGADAWQDLTALYARALNEDEQEELAMPKDVARGAAWGAMLEAYRCAPDSVAAVAPLASMLPRIGLPEASPTILAPVVKQNADPELATSAMRLLLAILASEDEAHDYESVRRVYQASEPLLAIAEAIHARTRIEPAPADVRTLTASMHVRAGHPERARPMLQQALQSEPSLHGYATLASVLLHAGAHADALEAISRGLKAPDAAAAPVGRAEAHMLAFQVQRAKGSTAQAAAALAD